jgi:hypothetical protein
MQRIGTLVVIVWLIIGVVAAAQRNYFSSSKANCAKLGTIAVTIVAGPLNYAGVNPKVKCQLPQPSKEKTRLQPCSPGLAICVNG